MCIRDSLHPVVRFLDQARLLERIEIDLGAILEDIQGRHIHIGVGRRENVHKASFGHPSLQGHLAAFKADPHAAARTGLLALVALTGGFALAGSVSAANSFVRMDGAWRRR